MAKRQVSGNAGDSQSEKAEIWKPVPSEPGVLASSWGRILQPPRHAPLPNGGYRLYLPEPRVGQVSCAAKGAAHIFLIVMVYDKDKRQRPRKVHQLVCEAFHGPKPFPGAVVMHLDEDATNNVPGNLRWGTQRENMLALKLTVYRRSRRGDLHPGVKYSDADVARIRLRVRSGEPQSKVAADYGMSSGQMSEIINGKRRA